MLCETGVITKVKAIIYKCIFAYQRKENLIYFTPENFDHLQGVCSNRIIVNGMYIQVEMFLNKTCKDTLCICS